VTADAPQPDTGFADRGALFDDLAAAVAKYADASGQPPHLAASIGAAMLHGLARNLADKASAEAAQAVWR
jgi:hypothetical protein